LEYLAFKKNDAFCGAASVPADLFFPSNSPIQQSNDNAQKMAESAFFGKTGY
jgi:hypothetical protein